MPPPHVPLLQPALRQCGGLPRPHARQVALQAQPGEGNPTPNPNPNPDPDPNPNPNPNPNPSPNPNQEGSALELCEFYSFASYHPHPARRGAGGAPADDDRLVGSVVAGMLPNGQRLGHRSLRQFYRQSKSFKRLYSHTAGPGRIGMRR